MQIEAIIDETDPRYIFINGQRLLRVMGGDGTEDDDDTGDDDDDDSSDDDTGDDDDDGSEEEDNDDDDDGKGDDLGQAERDELNRLRREKAESSRSERKKKNKAAKTEAELRKQLEAETRRADDNEEKLTKYEQTRAVEKVAKRLKAVYPDSIAKELTDEELHDEKSIERGLKRVKREKPRLFDEQRRSGGEIDDDTGGGKGRERGSSNGSDEAYGFSRLTQVERKNT